MSERPPCPLCGEPSSGSPWGGKFCHTQRCMNEEAESVPPHQRRGDVSLSTAGGGIYNAAVWVYLPSGRQFVIKSDRVPMLQGTERARFIAQAIGSARKETA